MTNLGLSSTSDVITFDQNWHHLYSTSAGGKDLSNDAYIRVISLMEPEICTEMLKKVNEKLRAKFPATTPTIMDKSVDTFEQNKRFLAASFRNFKKHFCR